MTDDAPDVVVDFDNDGLTADGLRVLSSVYGPMRGTVGERAGRNHGRCPRWKMAARCASTWRAGAAVGPGEGHRTPFARVVADPTAGG